MDPQQPTDRRPASAFVVFLVLMSGWFAFKTCQKANEPRPPPVTATPGVPPAGAPSVAGPDGALAGTPPPAPPVNHLFAVTKDVAQDDGIVVETDSFRARFSNHGAVLVELLLKEYFRKPGDGKDEAKRADPANWLPLIAPHDPKALTFRLIHNGRAAGSTALSLDDANWTVERSDADGAPRLGFKLDDGDGRHFEKWFTFRRDGYFFDVELRFSSVRPDAAQGTSSYSFVAAGGIWNEHNSKWAKPPAAVISAEDVDQIQLLDSHGLHDGPQSRAIRREELAPFFGARSNFFGFVLSPDAATAGYVDTVTCSRVLDPWIFEEARARRLSGRAELAPDEAAALRDESYSNVRAEPFLKVPFPAAGAAPLALRFTAFAGPRGPEAMAESEGEPFRILYEVEYGSWTTFRFINKLLLGWMGLLERLTGNWGVAIILLTVTVKALLFPLNRMQSRSMEQFQKKMKLLQPQIEEIKKRHKNNAQKAGVEQQKLMREHGVRPPFFGCLVLFLQMPVWYGVFQIMSSAPSLRHQPFFGWIADLSAPDVVPLPFALPMIGTLHLLPILMLVAWLLQNRMMPKPVDPQQAQMQKMMNFFPFIFLFMLYGYASGQSLYMVTNSLLGMVQMKFLRVTPSN